MSTAEMVRVVEAAVADLAACTDGELVEALAATERVRSAMAAHAAALTAACDHRQVWAGDGAASPAVWVAHQCDQPVADARRHLRHARRLEDMPETRAAFEAGAIGEAKAAMLAAARTDRLASEFDRCEPHLVASAKVLTCDQLAKVLTRWRLIARDAVDPDIASAPDGDDPQSRPSEVFLSQTLAGRYVLSGDLTAEDGAVLAHGIEAANRALFHRGARLSDGAELEPAQRRAVGLVETFKRGITADPDRSGAQPLVLATVDLGLLTRQAERQALRGRRRAPALGDGPDARRRPPDVGLRDGPPTAEEHRRTATRVAELVSLRCTHRGEPPPRTRRPVTAPGTTSRHTQRAAVRRDDHGHAVLKVRDLADPFDLEGLALVRAPDPADPFDLGLCEITGAGPIPVDAARRLACNGRVARLVLGADGTILDHGRAVRLATREQRQALVVRDRGCVFPGCDRAPGWCEAHHLDFFEDGGLTDLTNLALVCSHHHHLVHEGGWTLERTATGWVATSATGRRLHRAIPI
jgi:hypothetical protein